VIPGARRFRKALKIIPIWGMPPLVGYSPKRGIGKPVEIFRGGKKPGNNFW